MNKKKGSDENTLANAMREVILQKKENEKLALELGLANIELASLKKDKVKRAVELGIANKEFVLQDEEKEKRAAELGIANIELAYQDEEKNKRAAELVIADKELIYQNREKEKRAAELIIANKELVIADKELIFQNQEKGKRAAELIVANKELVYQNEEKEKRAAELIIANKELVYQNEEKEKRAAELIVANKELVYQNEEKEKRAAELIIANKELVYQNEEKEKRAAELIVANKELVYQNEEKEKRAAELIVANKELIYQNEEKEKRAAELIKANKELEFQNGEKERRAAELEDKNREVEAANRDIEKKTNQLEVSSRYKSEFLANMSHELRTPLNSLLILSKDLSENRRKNLDDEQVESAEIIYKSGHDLLVLINEVLDLSKIEAGKMDIHIEKIILQVFIEDIVHGFRHHTDEKGLDIRANFEGDLPEFVCSDAQRMKQILRNLISNAIKFTEKGSVTVGLRRHSADSIIISVTDTGIGIAENKQKAIFEAFQQADGTTSRKYGGTGLGLSISRELAKLLGAEIVLKSKFGEGSVFSVIVPLNVNAETKTSSDEDHELSEPVVEESLPDSELNEVIKLDSEKEEKSFFHKKRILLVDDDYRNVFALSKILLNNGMEVIKAGNGLQALELLASDKNIDLVLMDIMMPEMDGYEAMRLIRAQKKFNKLPVIAVTARAMSYDKQKCLRAGANGYITKPVEIESLMLMMGSLMGKKDEA